MTEVLEKAITPGGRIGDDSHFSRSKTSNWVARSGGLPTYILEVAHALIRQGKSRDHAIAIAVATMKRWAAGGGDVSPKVRAAAAKALAQWEAMKAKSHADNHVKKDDDYDRRIAAEMVSKFQNMNTTTDPVAEGNNLLQTIRDTYKYTNWAAPQGTMPYTTDRPTTYIPTSADLFQQAVESGEVTDAGQTKDGRALYNRRKTPKKVEIHLHFNFGDVLADAIDMIVHKGDKPGHPFRGNQWKKLTVKDNYDVHADDVHVGRLGRGNGWHAFPLGHVPGQKGLGTFPTRKAAAETVARHYFTKVKKGDKKGHPFRGNQWKDIAGSKIIDPYAGDVQIEGNIVRGVDPQTGRPIAYRRGRTRRKVEEGHSNTNPLDRAKRTLSPSKEVSEAVKKPSRRKPVPVVRNPTPDRVGVARAWINLHMRGGEAYEQEREYANELIRRSRAGKGPLSNEDLERFYGPRRGRPGLSRKRAREIEDRIYEQLASPVAKCGDDSRSRRKKKRKMIGDVTLLPDVVGKRAGDKVGHAFHGNQWVKVHVDQKKVDKFRATGRREHAADPSITVMLKKPLAEKDAVAILRAMLKNPDKYKGYDTSQLTEKQWLALHSLPKGYINKERFGDQYNLLAQLKTKTTPAKGQGAVKLRERALRPGGEIRKGNAIARQNARKELFGKWKNNSADGKVHCIHCDVTLKTHEETHFDKLKVGHQGGTYDPHNVVPACARCNQARGEKLDWVSKKGRTAYQSLDVWLTKNPKIARSIGYRAKHRTALARVKAGK